MKKILTFTASWCGPCKMVKPILQKLADQGKIVWENYDIDENKALADSHNVKAVPTLFFYGVDGNITSKQTGFLPEEKILEFYSIVPGFEETPAVDIKEPAVEVDPEPVLEAAPVVEETVVEEAAPVVEEVIAEEPIVETPVVEEAAPVIEEVIVEEVVEVVEEVIVEEEVVEVLEDPIVDSLGEDFEVDIVDKVLTPPHMAEEEVVVDIEVPAPVEEDLVLTPPVEVVEVDEALAEADDFIAKFLGASKEEDN